MKVLGNEGRRRGAKTGNVMLGKVGCEGAAGKGVQDGLTLL